MSADDEGAWAPGTHHDVQPTDVELTPVDWRPLPASVERVPSVVGRSTHPLVIVFGVVAALAIVAALVSSLVGSDDAEPPVSRPSTAVTVVADDGFAALRADQSATLLEAIPEAGEYLLFFRSGESLAILDFRDGSSETMDWGVPDGVDTVGFLYMASERGSWVIDPNDLSRALRLAPTSQIGVLQNPTRTAVLADASGTTTVFGGFFDGRSVRILAFVPVGAHAEVIQKLGVLISPVSGGSYLVQETSPTRVSEGRIVAANEDWFAEVLCDDSLQCTGNFRSWDNDEETPIALEVLTPPVVRISPNGRWILSGGNGRWSIFDVTAQTSVATGVEVDPNASVTWSPDSAFFLWIEARTLSAVRPELPTERVNLGLGIEPLTNLMASEIGFLPIASTE